jgi:hypothetical protein
MACSHRPRTVTGIVHADEIAEVNGVNTTAWVAMNAVNEGESVSN